MEHRQHLERQKKDSQHPSCSVTKSCPVLCGPMNCSTPGSPVLHDLEFAQTHVHGVGDAIQPSHPPGFARSYPFLTWRRQWHPTPVLLPGESHGPRSLVGCSPWGHTELDTTEGLHFHFSVSCLGEGNGNPLQCSCLENPRDRGAW